MALWALLASVAGCGDTTFIPQVEETKDPEAVRVTVSGWGEGAGLIRSAPHIECWYEGGQSRGRCQADLPPGTSLSFQALPRDTAVNGVAFEGWAGACANTGDTSCHVVVSTKPAALSAGFRGVTRVSGALFHPRAGTDMSALTVSLVANDTLQGSVPVAANGAFDGKILGTFREAGTLDLVVDVRQGQRTMYPAFRRLRAWELADPQLLVMVPRTWTFTEGVFQGRTVPVDLTPALGTDPSFYTTTGQSLAAKVWQFQVQTVTWDRLPLTLAVDQAGSTAQVWDIDVERYWRRINELEAVMGRDLFAPARSVATADVVVAVRPGACGRATACANVISGDPYLEDGAQVFHQSVEQFREDRGIVAHELSHVLGMGHTCRWTSVMYLGPEQCGGQGAPSPLPTETDVAYMQLALAVNSLQKAQDMDPYGGGLMAAWNGQRVVIEGKSPWLPPGCVQCGG